VGGGGGGGGAYCAGRGGEIDSNEGLSVLSPIPRAVWSPRGRGGGGTDGAGAGGRGADVGPKVPLGFRGSG